MDTCETDPCETDPCEMHTCETDPSNELINIIDSFTLPDAFTPDEELEIVETAYTLIVDLLNAEPMMYIQPYFHEAVILEITELLHDQFQEAISYDIESDLNLCVEQAMKIFYKEVAPKRSHTSSFIRIRPNNNYELRQRLKNKINYLQSIPQPEQRTAEWYNFRYKFLTASSIWKAFVSESTRNQLIYDKCKPFNAGKYSHTSTDSPLHWGQKYEAVSSQLYETMYNTKVGEFGCIPHKTLPYLAASPDGINILETSNRYGRMLEIKNIVNREIDGNPKMEYWIQMQLQMEVCNLNECDFLETRFKEYEDEEAFFLDSMGYNINTTKDGKQKGMMIQFMVYGQPYYEYAPLNATREDMAAWELAMMDKHVRDIWVKNIYWRLDELSCVLVLRNKFWFKHAIPILNDFWKIIEYEKVNGYEHRSPNKKIKMDHVNTLEVVKLGFCFDVDMDTVNIVKEDNMVLTIDTEMLSHKE
jgi:putative phage-type endonuclease